MGKLFSMSFFSPNVKPNHPFCRDTGKYCDQIKEFQATTSTTTHRPKIVRMEPNNVIIGTPFIPYNLPTTPYPYFRESKEAFGINSLGSSQPPELSDFFFKEPFEKQKPSYFPKSKDGSSEFVSTVDHDEHIKHFPPHHFNTNLVKDGKFTTSKIPLQKKKPQTFPMRKLKKFRSHNPTKTPNFFEKYFNAFKGLKLPKLPIIRSSSQHQNDHTRKKSSQNKKRNKKTLKKNLNFWGDEEEDEDSNDIEGIFSGQRFSKAGFEAIPELKSFDRPQYDYYSS